MGGNLNPLTPAVMAQWPTPNYVNPPQRTWYAAYAAVLQAISTILILLRFWMRGTNRAGQFGLDDVRTHDNRDSCDCLADVLLVDVNTGVSRRHRLHDLCHYE